jgi:hypothetical protein
MNRQSNGYQIFRVGLDVLSAIALGLIFWLFWSVVEVDKRVVAIESSNFTQTDAIVLQRQLSTLPSTAPPPWFIERVQRLENRIDGVDGKLDKLLSKQRGP